MWSSVLDSFRTTLVAEGYCRFMYLDERCLVTTGQGDLIDPVEAALALPWLEGSLLASGSLVGAAWSLVKSRTDLAPKGGMAFASLTTLRLTDGAVSLLVTRTMNMMIEILERRLVSLEAAPADAQMAMLRWAWANGASAMFPKLFAAFETGDYATCALESEWRNESKATRTVMDHLWQNATDSAANALDPSVLLWPGIFEKGVE